ncbi:MAG: vanadium-dependent haloperoxidase [Anaerolinea sp.]|nr:vanadium-dependent haloperoxidase [Anaerolinea sp.]
MALLLLSTTLVPARETRAQQGVPATELDPAFAVEWMDLLYQKVMLEEYTPPAAARLYAYAGITLYESIVWGLPTNQSLGGQLNGLGALPFPEDGEYDWAAVADAALGTVLHALTYESSDETRAAFLTMREEQLAARLDEVGDEAVINRSIEYGDELAAEIVDWSEADGYRETRGRKYDAPTGDPSLWVLTNPDLPALEPYFGEVRTFALYYTDECDVRLDMPFNTEPESTFYRQALEVMTVGNDLSREQRDIAQYWLDNLGETGTPAGHWLLIENQLVEQLDLTLDLAAQMYGMVNIAMADSFTSCWGLKYRVLLLRPETYINEYINPRWRPYITTPMFPEYPSGHSTVSGAAAEMLTALFGQVAFTDSSKVQFGMGSRAYTSFDAAAQEAAISRLYGGIHYRAAIENGMDMGRCVALHALDRIVMNQLTQGE